MKNNYKTASDTQFMDDAMSLLERVIEGRVSFKGRVASSIDQSGMSVFLQPENFVVPVGVIGLKILALGASGGSGNAFGVLLNNDGQAGIAVANVLVTAGESIDVFVGGNGHDGRLPDGGKGGCSMSVYAGVNGDSGAAGGDGGGGASGAIRVLDNELLIVAGGGGSGAGKGGVIGRGAAGNSFTSDGFVLSTSKIQNSEIGCTTDLVYSKLGRGGCGGGLVDKGELISGSCRGGAGGFRSIVGILDLKGNGRGNAVVLVALVYGVNTI